jgi:hypothetical protein
LLELPIGLSLFGGAGVLVGLVLFAELRRFHVRPRRMRRVVWQLLDGTLLQRGHVPRGVR